MILAALIIDCPMLACFTSLGMISSERHFSVAGNQCFPFLTLLTISVLG